MLTIGRILEENLTFLNMTIISFVKIGKEVHLFHNTNKDVLCRLLANIVMGGKNKNFIHSDIK